MSNNNQYYTPDGNNNYYQGNGNYYAGSNGNYYAGGNQQYYMQDPLQQQNNDEEEGSSINIMEWVFVYLHYWYLFVIAIAIALGLAMLKNRRWIPSYYSQGTIVIKENTGYGGASLSLMQGFGVDAGYKNVNNQMIMLTSYDLISRVVDSLPYMQVEYISQGRFKTRNLYRNSPIVIDNMRVDMRAYNTLFALDFHNDGTMHISSMNESIPLDLVTRYGEPVSCNLFDIIIWPTELMINSGRLYFRFRDHESLVNEFMGGLQLQFVREGSTVLSMALVSETPQRDCEFLDMLAKVYLLQNLEKKNEVAENSIRFIDQQLDTLKASLRVSEGAMTDFRQENRFIDVSTYAGQLMGMISGYNQQALDLRLRETYFDYLINYIHTNMDNDAVIAPSTMGLSEPTLAGLVQRFNDIRIQRSELTEKNVYYAKYTKEMETIKSSIEEVVKSMRATLEIEKMDLKRRYEEAEDSLKTLPEKELQMVAIERNYRIDDNYYTFFLQKRAEAEIQKASNTPDNSIMDKARTLSVMNMKTKQKNTSTFLLIGFLIPFVLITLSELLNNKIRSPKDVVKMRVFRLIGTLRHARNQNPTLVKDAPRSTYAEMLRAIRTRMEFVLRRKTKMVVCITSTESGDGKTFISTNLAALYAMGGKKTLLIDLDIRKPNIHTKLALENGNGISNYLAGDCELDEVMIKNTPFGFDFMRAGTIPPNPGELIHSDKLTELLTQKREEYDFIVIDTSPIGLVPDAYAIIEQSDMCLFVIRCMQTNKSFCRQTLDQMRSVVDNPEKIQLILSDIALGKNHTYGYGYAGYGYGYGNYGGYGGYGYGYGGYGYGYGSYSSKHRSKRYGKLYGKLYDKFIREDKAYQAYNYYHDDEVDEESKDQNS